MYLIHRPKNIFTERGFNNEQQNHGKNKADSFGDV